MNPLVFTNAPTVPGEPELPATTPELPASKQAPDSFSDAMEKATADEENSKLQTPNSKKTPDTSQPDVDRGVGSYENAMAMLAAWQGQGQPPDPPPMHRAEVSSGDGIIVKQDAQPARGATDSLTDALVGFFAGLPDQKVNSAKLPESPGRAEKIDAASLVAKLPETMELKPGPKGPPSDDGGYGKVGKPNEAKTALHEKPVAGPAHTEGKNAVSLDAEGEASPDSNGKKGDKESSHDSQASGRQLDAKIKASGIFGAADGGTGAAFRTLQMKLAPEQKEIAQITTQRGASTGSASLDGSQLAGSGEQRATPILAGGFLSDKSIEQAPINVTPLGLSGLDEAHTEAAGTVVMTAPTDRAEQVQSLIAREVVTIRQSGADALAVSLKVDTHTDILLQLTNHNGQIEAAVRCERGDATVLSDHWGQLQQSLAHQNVHLLPLEDRTAARMPSQGSDRAAADGQNFSFDQQKSPRHPLAQSGALEAGQASNSKISKPGSTRAEADFLSKPQTRRTRLDGWESWA